MLLVTEVVAAEFEVVERHGKAHGAVVLRHFVVVPGDEALDALDVVGNRGFHIQRRGLVQRGKTALDGVDQVILHLFEFFVGDVALERDHAGGEHLAALALCEQLDALLGGVAALVILTGEIFHREYLPAVLNGERLLINHIGVRLGEHDALCIVIFLFRQTLHIVAHDIAQVGDASHSEIVSDVPESLLRHYVEALPLFHKNSDYV